MEMDMYGLSFSSSSIDCAVLMKFMGGFDSDIMEQDYLTHKMDEWICDTCNHESSFQTALSCWYFKFQP